MTVSILIASAGRRAGLSNAFRESAAALGLDARIIATDLRPELSAACALADVAYPVPRVTDPDYPAALLDICKREDVRLVIPTIDTELMPLAQARSLFEEQGIHVNVASTDFVGIARDKLTTAQRLQDAGIPTPRTATRLPLDDATGLHAPVIIKPRDGSSSNGLQIVRTEAELADIALPANSIVQELLEGPEFTVNTFYDRAGNFRAAIPHRRIETRGGEMSKGRTERHAEFTAIAESMRNVATGVRGVFCFQGMLTAAGPVIFEINARFGGGYPLAHHAGGTFARWLIEEALGRECTAADTWRSDVTALRYDMEVYR